MLNNIKVVLIMIFDLLSPLTCNVLPVFCTLVILVTSGVSEMPGSSHCCSVIYHVQVKYRNMFTEDFSTLSKSWSTVLEHEYQ